MKKVKIDVTNIHTVGALHVYLAYMLDLPAHYGRNLDALHDCLSTESEETRILLMGKACSDEMRAYLPRLEQVLGDCAEDNEKIIFEKV